MRGGATGVAKAALTAMVLFVVGLLGVQLMGGREQLLPQASRDSGSEATVRPRGRELIAYEIPADDVNLGELSVPGKFYMYVGPEFNFKVLSKCYKRDHKQPIWRHELMGNVQNLAELWAYSRLRDHPNRTLDPEEADLFYAPIPFFTSFKTGKCNHTTHELRMVAAVEALRRSPYWRRYNGADHLFICSYYKCGEILEPLRTKLRAHMTALLVIHGRLQRWTRWKCPSSVIVGPYVFNTAINRANGHKTFSQRHHSFFFAGCTRGHQSKRDAIKVLEGFSDAYIDIHSHCSKFTTKPEQYAKIIQNTKFCLNPRGDTFTSRRLYDSIEAGCIPILEEGGIRDSLPFTWKLDYDSFAIFAPEGTLQNKKKLLTFSKNLLKIDEQHFEEMQAKLLSVRDEVMWGTGSPLSRKNTLGKAADNIIEYAMKKVDMRRQSNWNLGCPSDWEQFEIP